MRFLVTAASCFRLARSSPFSTGRCLIIFGWSLNTPLSGHLALMRFCSRLATYTVLRERLNRRPCCKKWKRPFLSNRSSFPLFSFPAFFEFGKWYDVVFTFLLGSPSTFLPFFFVWSCVRTLELGEPVLYQTLYPWSCRQTSPSWAILGATRNYMVFWFFFFFFFFFLFAFFSLSAQLPFLT